MDDLLTAGSMRMCPSGAHLTSTDTDFGELFYLSSATGSGPGTAIRGGVPVIAPAFADLIASAPRHGWARTAAWKVTTDGRDFHAEVDNDGICLRLDVRELADGVRLELTARNESREDRKIRSKAPDTVTSPDWVVCPPVARSRTGAPSRPATATEATWLTRK